MVKTSYPTHILVKPIDKVNSRLCVERLQVMYERDSFVIETGGPKGISMKRDKLTCLYLLKHH